ncbi:hypothetical protein NEIRO03_2256 [Nematocida sp. AWRm78]|nr:hypothetical protein NEIRO03_2256 [Nematocida sp. AWRm78]
MDNTEYSSINNIEHNTTQNIPENQNNLIVKIYRNSISRLQSMYSLIIIPFQIWYLLFYSNFTVLSIIFLLLGKDSESLNEFYTIKITGIVMCTVIMLFTIPVYVYSILRHRSILLEKPISNLLNTLAHIVQCIIEILCTCGIIIMIYFFICTRVWVKWINIIFILINLIIMIIGLDYTQYTQRRLNIVEVFNKSVISDEEDRYGISYYLYCTMYTIVSILIISNYDVFTKNGLIYTEK